MTWLFMNGFSCHIKWRKVAIKKLTVHRKEAGELANINMPLGSMAIKIENWEKHILHTLHHLQLYYNILPYIKCHLEFMFLWQI